MSKSSSASGVASIGQGVVVRVAVSRGPPKHGSLLVDIELSLELTRRVRKNMFDGL